MTSPPPTLRPFNRADIAERIADLARSHRAAFIASCASRLSDFFEAFSREEKAGDPSLIRMGVRALWDYSAHGVQPSEELRDAIELQCPEDGSVHKSIFTPMAQYSYDSVTMGIDFVLGRYEDAAVDVAIGSQTAVELYLAAVNQVFIGRTSITTYTSTSNVDYCGLPLFVAELSKQVQDIEVLRRAKAVDDATIAELLESGSFGVRPVERFCID